MKKILLVLLLAGALGAGVWFYFKQSANDTSGDKPQKPVARVEVAPLKMQTIVETLHAWGQIAGAPSGEQAVAATFDCVVRSVRVSAGTRVKEGDVLLEVTPSPEAQLQADAARSTLALAVKALAAAQERYDLKISTTQDLLAAQQTEQDARQKLGSLERRGLGGDGRITAPVAGIVQKVEVSAGASAVAGTTLATIAGGTGLEARLGVELTDVSRVAPGQKVTLISTHRPDAGPTVSTVRLIGGSLDATTGSVEVRATVPTGAPLLLGEHVTAEIDLREKNALVAPRSAVLPDGDKFVLYTAKEGHAVRHEVTPGIEAGDVVEVSANDLHPGDSVVTLGNYELSDGMEIQVQDGTGLGETKP